MQGIRAPAPSRLFPITMTASGLSPEDENGQLLPREQRELIIKVGLEEKVTSLTSVLGLVSSPLWCWELNLGFLAKPVLSAEPRSELYQQPLLSASWENWQYSHLLLVILCMYNV